MPTLVLLNDLLGFGLGFGCEIKSGHKGCIVKVISLNRSMVSDLHNRSPVSGRVIEVGKTAKILRGKNTAGKTSSLTATAWQQLWRSQALKVNLKQPAKPSIAVNRFVLRSTF